MSSDSLGVEVHPHWLQLHGGISFVQRSQDFTLSGPSIADDKDGVSHVSQFFQLYHFENKVILSLQSKFLYMSGGLRGASVPPSLALHMLPHHTCINISLNYRKFP